MTNFISYEYRYVIPSDLSSEGILMLGRGDDKIKRFELGIKAMKFIIRAMPTSIMKIISNINNLNYLKELVNKLNIGNNIEFVGYTSEPERYFKNASLHIFPTLVESFGNALSETLIYGIPNILLGLDYVTVSKWGTVIIYDDSPITLANAVIKILKNSTYKKELGKQARKNMQKFRNNNLLERWKELIISIYKGEDYYQLLRQNDTKISELEYKKIIENQLKLLKMRKKEFRDISINDIENFTFMENLIHSKYKYKYMHK